MSASPVVPSVLPFLQARAEFLPLLRPVACPAILPRVQASDSAADVPNQPQTQTPPRPQLAFYRKYTEALLRRYVRMSLEVGRVPSLLGREMFRAKVSSYRMESFEDAVIFCHDVERSIGHLTALEQSMIEHIALKQYTVAETAQTFAMDPRTAIRQYTRALDRLTAIFLQVEILNPAKCCQAPKPVENAPYFCN